MMKAINLLHNYRKGVATLTLGVAALFFWGLCYPAHLTFQEQFQLFLWDADYWWSIWRTPGGVADYLAEFLTQWFLFSWMGAVVMALLLMTIQRLIWALAQEMGATDRDYGWTFLPVLLLGGYLLDESVMLAYVVALIMALLAALSYVNTEGKWHRTVFVVLVTPSLYWMTGPAHFLFAGWLMVYEMVRNVRRRDLWSGIGIAWGVGVLAVSVPMLAVLFAHYPAYRLLCGVDYYRYPEVVPWMQLAFWPLIALWPQLMGWLARWQPKKRALNLLRMTECLLLLAALGWSATRMDMEKEEVMQYDYLVRNRQWRRVIAMADEKRPTSPLSVTCLNLALAKSGQMPERMFTYYQNGLEGLLPTFVRDYFTPLPLGEVFYHIGMVNSAQRIAFETMEAIPNYKKSARAVKRLAETNLINGQYEVAAKYLRMLKKTLFYDRWAEQAEEAMGDEAKINAHAEWGWLRQVRYTDDYLFSEDELADMFGLLFTYNPKNRLAYEYLMAYVMEQRDVDRFMRYYPLGSKVGYKAIPRHYQELLALVWTQQHGTFEGMPWSLSPLVMQEMSDFARLHMAKTPEAKATLQTKYGATYWYYLMYPETLSN